MEHTITGKARRKLKQTIKALEYQQIKWGHSEVREARIKDITEELKKFK